jgi:hypothetical protein
MKAKEWAKYPIMHGIGITVIVKNVSMNDAINDYIGVIDSFVRIAQARTQYIIQLDATNWVNAFEQDFEVYESKKW